MQVNINITGDELDHEMAARQLRLMAKMVEQGMMHVEGFSIDFMGPFMLDVDLGGEFPHGDYQDEEGNLLHVANDHVVNVTWASKNAEVEEVNIAVADWVEEHGPIKPAGHGEGHHHEH